MIQAHQYNHPYKSNPQKNGLLKPLMSVVLGSCLLMACHNKGTNGKSESNEVSGIKIGDQVWAATNLEVTTFRNGDSIPEVRSNEA